MAAHGEIPFVSFALGGKYRGKIPWENTVGPTCQEAFRVIHLREASVFSQSVSQSVQESRFYLLDRVRELSRVCRRQHHRPRLGHPQLYRRLRPDRGVGTQQVLLRVRVRVRVQVASLGACVRQKKKKQHKHTRTHTNAYVQKRQQYPGTFTVLIGYCSCPVFLFVSRNVHNNTRERTGTHMVHINPFKGDHSFWFIVVHLKTAATDKNNTSTRYQLWA